MEKRTLRSSTRAAAAAAAGTGIHDDKNSDGNSAPTTTTGVGAGKFKDLYKPNPIAKTAKEGINKRVSDDVKLRKQRRDELVSAKRFKRSDDAKEATGKTGHPSSFIFFIFPTTEWSSVLIIRPFLLWLLILP